MDLSSMGDPLKTGRLIIAIAFTFAAVRSKRVSSGIQQELYVLC